MNSKHVLFAMLVGTFAGMASAGGGVYPEPAVPEAPEAKSRAEVMAEAAEVTRLGLLNFGEGDAPIATPEQERLIALAVRRAAEHERIAQNSTPTGE